MIILDIETTGIDGERSSLLSIGAIDFRNTEERFYEECRAWDGALILPEALDFNGFTEEDIKDPNKKSDIDIIQNFLDWLDSRQDKTIGGQNISGFDINFLNAVSKRYSFNIEIGRRVVDQHSIVIAHMLQRGIDYPLKNNRSDLDSDKIMKYVGIPAEPRPHIAINGAVWEAEAMHRLIYNKSLFEEFNQYPIPWMIYSTKTLKM